MEFNSLSIEVMLLESEDKQQRITDEIMKYKELLDDGIITEEEFSIKKKELLFFLNRKS